jgi:uncharacterized protein DUF5658
MAREDVASLAQFILLQFSDIVSTLLLVALGVGEANPLIRWAMRAAGNPLTGLVLAKAALVPLVVYAILAGRRNPLRMANVGFTALILWNLTAILFKVLTPNI